MRVGEVKHPLRALTIIQPWAELIVRGPKRVENRGWEPPRSLVGAYLAIHAGKALDWDCWGGAAATARAAGLLGTLPVIDGGIALGRPERGDRFARGREKDYALSACPYGAIVGVARVAGVETTAPAGDPWWFGPVGWRLADVVAIDPLHCNGAQGLWVPSPEVVDIVRERYRASRVRAA